MSEDETVPDNEEQEEFIEQSTPEPEQRQVPLQALEAERRKRQDLEAQVRAMQASQSEPDDEDEEEFITKAEMNARLKAATFGNRREILEESFCDSNPKAVELINQHLKEIINRKPWLAQTIESAPNRYARAYEIVQDYMPKDQAVSDRLKQSKDDARRIVDNSKKPLSPVTVAKASQASNADYLRSIQGTSEFREYRKKMMSGR